MKFAMMKPHPMRIAVRGANPESDEELPDLFVLREPIFGEIPTSATAGIARPTAFKARVSRGRRRPFHFELDDIRKKLGSGKPFDTVAAEKAAEAPATTESRFLKVTAVTFSKAGRAGSFKGDLAER